MTRMLTVAALVLLLPALALAQKTSFDFDKTAEFAKFKTYTFKDGKKVGDPLIDKRIVAALETELAAKGLTKNDATPDLVVVYHVMEARRGRPIPRRRRVALHAAFAVGVLLWLPAASVPLRALF